MKMLHCKPASLWDGPLDHGVLIILLVLAFIAQPLLQNKQLKSKWSQTSDACKDGEDTEPSCAGLQPWQEGEGNTCLKGSLMKESMLWAHTIDSSKMTQVA